MTTLLTGYLSVDTEINDRLPYINNNGRYYSELIADFTPAVGTEGGKKTGIIVRGTFDKDTYAKGKKDGFEVVMYDENQRKFGRVVYQADDRTRAHQSVTDIQLQDALQTLDGVGKRYSEGLIKAFNNEGDFFRNLYNFLNGIDTTLTCSVPKKVLHRVLDNEQEVMTQVRMRSIHEAKFYNVLNRFGLVSFKKQSVFPYQRGINEWSEMYNQLSSIVPGEMKKKTKHEIFANTSFVEEYGEHVALLVARPELALQVYGKPMANSVQAELKNVALAHALIEVANSEFEDDELKTYGLEEDSLLTYSFDLYGIVKEFKDGGFDNPHSGDTMFPFTQRMHQQAFVKQGLDYDFDYDDVVKALSHEDNPYPLVTFELDGQMYIQFKETFKMNRETVQMIHKRVAGEKEPFAYPKEYMEHLDNVIEDNQFGLHQAQYNTLLGLNDYKMSVLTGGPGTGKTTILSVFLRTLSKVDKSLFASGAHKIVFCAPTGKAAKRMKDSLNAFVDEYPILKQVQSQTYTNHAFLMNKKEVLENAKGAPNASRWLVIDESSMVDEEMLHWLLKSVPTSYRIVFIGDEEQLPSIGAGSVLEDLLELPGVGRFNLTEPYRSTGTVMQNAYKIRNAAENKQRIRVNDLTWDNNFSILDYDQLVAMHKTQLGKDDSYYNFVMEHAPDLYDGNTYSGWTASFLYKQIEDNNIDPNNTMFLMPFSNGKGRADRLAVTPFNQAIQGLMQPFRHILPDALASKTYDEILAELNRENGTSLFDVNAEIHSRRGIFNGIGANNSVIFRMGDKVISTNNQYETLIFKPESLGLFKDQTTILKDVSKLWYARLQKEDLLVESKFPVMNGDMGVVKAILKDGSLMVQYDDQEDGRWVFYKRDVNFKDHLALSYSNTIHKAQGGEADTVVVFLPAKTDISTMNYRELIYTAITRARTKVVILGSKAVLEEALNATRGNRLTALPYLFTMKTESSDKEVVDSNGVVIADRGPGVPMTPEEVKAIQDEADRLLSGYVPTVDSDDSEF